MTFVYDKGEPVKTAVLMKMEDSQELYQALKTIDFQENCLFDITENGLRVIVDDQNAVQGVAYFKPELFAEFIINQSVVTFCIPFFLFAECLCVFGMGVSTVLKMTYDGHGEPFVVMLEKDGIVVRCLIKTVIPDTMLDFDFNPADVAAKVLMKPAILKEIFLELDPSTPTIGFRIDENSISVITDGDLGKIQQVESSFLL
ncbi:unnamed protein product [Gongylonema pulchrum]|uniref:Proliferating cell nuclear antigen n=1 Tax=Gongylonema pulchrum TaxID=637853 RepID=A0A183EJN5_9BILA|nr:unnamed protein product [Gongylonema pulchrum]